MNNITILIGGDLAPVRRYEEKFSNEDFDFIDSEILKEFEQSNFSVVNLEAPLSKNKPIKKRALPNLVANPNVVNGIKSLKVDACCLGNNHILDAEAKGLLSTISLLNENKIDCFGAGLNCKESNQLFIKEIDNKKIGFYSISNNEYSIATNTTAGANPEDLVNWYYDIQKFKKEVDFLIILYHTGIERSIYPSPNLQKKCKLLIDLGADLVTCQHSHVTGTFEKYQGKNIFYGQGDFIFDYGADIEDYRRFGNLLKLEIINNRIEVKVIYFKKIGITIKLLKGKEKEEFEKEMFNKSKNVLDSKFLDNAYNELVIKNKSHYFNIFFSFGNLFLLRALNKLNFTKYFYSKSYSKILLNIIQNDIHKDMLVKILKKRI